jgi:hypothetical protein
MECTIETTPWTGRLHCATCDRDYAVYRNAHVCGEIKCAYNPRAVTSTLEDRYMEKLPAGSRGGHVDLVTCDECNSKAARLATPRLATCPKCAYKGRYVHDGSKICPVCVNAPPPPTPTRTPTVTTTAPVIPPDIFLFAYTTTTKCPGFDLTVRAVTPDRQLLMLWPSGHDTLAEWLQKIHSEYHVMWRVTPNDALQILDTHLWRDEQHLGPNPF